MVTVPFSVPAGSAAGLAVMRSVAGMIPLIGVTVSHGELEIETLKGSPGIDPLTVTGLIERHRSAGAVKASVCGKLEAGRIHQHRTDTMIGRSRDQHIPALSIALGGRTGQRGSGDHAVRG